MSKVTLQDTAIMLRKAATLLETNGWAAGKLINSDGSMCAIGAISKVVLGSAEGVGGGLNHPYRNEVVRLHLYNFMKNSNDYGLALYKNRSLECFSAEIIYRWNDTHYDDNGKAVIEEFRAVADKILGKLPTVSELQERIIQLETQLAEAKAQIELLQKDKQSLLNRLLFDPAAEERKKLRKIETELKEVKQNALVSQISEVWAWG